MMHPIVRPAVDALAAAAFSAAIWFSLTAALGLTPLFASCAASVVFIGLFRALQRLALQGGASADFVPAPLEFEADELVLTHPIDASSRVVRLFGPLPTPGEMHQRIEEHLQEAQRPTVDASAELRDALAQLRRAIS